MSHYLFHWFHLQQPPPPYPNQQGNGAIPTKRYRPDELSPNQQRPVAANQMQPQQFYLSAPQLQILQQLQKNKDNLNPQQQAMLAWVLVFFIFFEKSFDGYVDHVFLPSLSFFICFTNQCSQLMNNYRMMQQHQQQLRLQQQQQMQMQMQSPPQNNPQIMPNAQQQGFPQMQAGGIGLPGQQQQQSQQPQDIQAILSQNDSKTALAENLLKQFGANIKQEISDDDKMPMVADSTTNLPSQSPQTIKCEATSTSRRSPTDLKNEPALKIENIFEPSRRVEFDIQMSSKQIAEAVK